MFPADGKIRLVIRSFDTKGWNEVGLYEVELKVQLTNFLAVHDTIKFKVFVLYPCTNLGLFEDNGTWAEAIVPDMALYLEGYSRKFEGNFMLHVNEQLKFKYAGVSKNSSELLCGKRKTILYPCAGPDKAVMRIFSESITQGTFGKVSLYTAKATEHQQVGMHNMCIKAIFADYPELIMPVHRF